LDELPISLHILTFQIVEELPSTAHHSEQTPTGMVDRLGEGQVLAYCFDPRGETGNLDFWRAGITVMKVIVFHHLLFSGQILCHDLNLSPNRDGW
jgi:hypothetical protein